MFKFEEIDLDTFFEVYKPIKNPFDSNASFDGHMFETYGEEVEFVKQQDESKIWMFGDGDDGGGYIWSGWGFVNRIGYFITEVPAPADTTIQVKVNEPWYFCENCHAELEDPDNKIWEKYSDLEKCPECATIQEKALLEEEGNE